MNVNGHKIKPGVDRDAQKLAMKCHSLDEGYFTDLEGRTNAVEVLETVFENGEITRTYTFEEVRANASVAFTGQV